MYFSHEWVSSRIDGSIFFPANFNGVFLRKMLNLIILK